MDTTTFEVVVVGAGAAGRSAALVLGRARRTVAVIDDGQPSNLPSEGIGGLLGHDGRAPADFYAHTDAELAKYPTIVRRAGRVTAVDQAGASSADGWALTVDDGSSVRARHVVLAHGMEYAHPTIEGIEERWGASVFHCPFCHGWEHRDERLAVLGGPMTVERAQLLASWTDRVVVIAGAGQLTDDERTSLAESGIEVVVGEVSRLDGDGRRLAAVELRDGTRVDVTGMLVAAPHVERTPRLVEALGLEVDESGHVVADDFGATSRPGIWAAGDLTSMQSAVSRVIAAGQLTAVGIVRELAAERQGWALSHPPVATASR